MAKLKNYEIDALCNNITKKLREIKTEKIEALKGKIKLSKDAKKLIELAEEYHAVNERLKELDKMGVELRKKVFENTGYNYGWMSTKEDEILKYEAEKLLPEKLKEISIDNYRFERNIRDRIIVANIDGNVQDLIDKIVEEYND